MEKRTGTSYTRLIGLVALVADAPVGAERVNAEAVPAEIGYRFALVDI